MKPCTHFVFTLVPLVFSLVESARAQIIYIDQDSPQPVTAATREGGNKP